MLWTGRILSGLVGALLVMSATMKLTGNPEVEAGFTHLGFNPSIAITIGVIELACVVLYLVPHTAMLGAILLTGYMGGVIVTHMRLDEPVLIPLVLGVVVWLGLFLRDPRLHRLVPLRSL
jgi:hypothetical protein